MPLNTIFFQYSIGNTVGVMGILSGGIKEIGWG